MYMNLIFVLITAFWAVSQGLLCMQSVEPSIQSKALCREERSLISPLSQSWYKNRQQHISKHQRFLLREYWPTFGITLEYSHVLNRTLCFPSITEQDKLVLDIGFGNGDSTIGMAVKSSENQKVKSFYLGCEIHKAGLANVIDKLQASGLDNVKVIRSEVYSLFTFYLAANMVDEICIFFPDPWINADRDGKRRVVRAETLESMARIMRVGGRLHIATDVQDYYEHCLQCVQQFNLQPERSQGKMWRLEQDVSRKSLEEDREEGWRPVTHYERKAFAEGRAVHDLIYKLTEL